MGCVIHVQAQCLGISVDLIRISECASDRIHNTSPTAASMGADINGMATLNACEQIMARLNPVREGKLFSNLLNTYYIRNISSTSSSRLRGIFDACGRFNSCMLLLCHVNGQQQIPV